MTRRPPRSTRTDTLLPYPTLFRSRLGHPVAGAGHAVERDDVEEGRRGADRALHAGRRRVRRDEECDPEAGNRRFPRSEEHTSELQSLMRISYAVFCLQIRQTDPNSTQTLATTWTQSWILNNS